MATLAFMQNRLGRSDGVSLEVDKWRVILTNPGLKREMGEKNFAIAKKQFSLDTLEQLIRSLLGKAGIV